MTVKKQKNLTPTEKKRMVAILAEMRARGMEIPKLASISVVDDWNTDEGGFVIRDDGYHYRITPVKQLAWECRSRYIGLWGRRGCGKTAFGAQMAIRKIKAGEPGVIINPDMENFKLSTWPELKKWIPWDMVVPNHRYRKESSWEPQRPFVIAFTNGAIIYCKGLKNPDSARGPNVNWLWYDEAGRDDTGIGWRLAIAGVRIGKDPQAWATYTPKSFEHWTYKFFVNKEVPDELHDILEEAHWPEDVPIISEFHLPRTENEENLDPFFMASLVAAYPSGYLRLNELEGEYSGEEGTLGDRRWFNGQIFKDALIPEAWGRTKILRYWDLAASEKKIGTDPDETVGSLVVCSDSKEDFCLKHQFGGYWAWDDIKKNILEIAKMDGVQIPVWIELEPGSGGKNQVAEIKNLLKKYGFTVRGHRPGEEGDRVMAANTWFGEAAQKHWWLFPGSWNDRFLNQLDSFPSKKAHDDRITSVSGARHILAPAHKWSRTKFLHMGAGFKPTEGQKKHLGMMSLRDISH